MSAEADAMTDAALRAAAREIDELYRDMLAMPTDAEADIAQVVAILARHLAPPAGPTHCFNADDWDVTYEWSDRADLHDGMFCGDVLRVGRLTRLADQWVACVPVTFDENGAPDETEMRWFNSFEEANAAANPPLAAAPPPPPSDGEKG
jgi:hypothetical protein